MKSIFIPQSRAIDGSIRIPGSKSLSNRAILIASLAKGQSILEGVLDSDDTKHMIQAWIDLGVSVQKKQPGEVHITGCAGLPGPFNSEIYVENAGTAARFLTAALTLGQGSYTLNGNERMQQRPILDLINALKELGASLRDLQGTGCPPVKIEGGLKGGSVSIPGEKSSQYVSALMMTAPLASQDTTINITGELVSRTYVEMTRKIMETFQVNCEWRNEQTIYVPGQQQYLGQHYQIEGDASSASYFFGMAAITGGRIEVSGIQRESTQGDIGLVNVLEKMGCHVEWQQDRVILEGRPLKAVDVDMNTMSDVAPTLAVVALFAEGKTTITNVGNMRIKECDRIAAVTTELRKLGAEVEELEEGLIITGNGNYQGAELATYLDHRMAMSFSLAGLRIPGVKILDPGCVSKTFPDFYDYFLPLIQE